MNLPGFIFSDKKFFEKKFDNVIEWVRVNNSGKFEKYHQCNIDLSDFGTLLIGRINLISNKIFQNFWILISKFSDFGPIWEHDDLNRSYLVTYQCLTIIQIILKHNDQFRHFSLSGFFSGGNYLYDYVFRVVRFQYFTTWSAGKWHWISYS